MTLLVLIRGLPGSGKTTMAKVLAEVGYDHHRNPREAPAFRQGRMSISEAHMLKHIINAFAIMLAQQAVATETIAPHKEPIVIKKAKVPDPWFGRDKAIHFGGSVFLGGVARSIMPDRPWYAFGAAFAPGILLELRPGQHKSFRDLAADAAGAAVGVYVGGLFIHARPGGAAVAYAFAF